jgi:PhnB protein
VAGVSIYLTFMGDCEEAFTFYADVFGGELDGLQRMREVPADPSRPPLPEHEEDLVMHVALPILGGTVLMGTDMLASMGHELRVGNNISINLEPDTYEEGLRIFTALAQDDADAMPLQPMFWGSYWGSCLDRFGVRWMVNAPGPQHQPGQA